jgi:transposase
LNRAIAELDQELERRTAQIAPALLELPACAAVTAAKLVAEIGPVERFRSSRELAAYAGLVPTTRSSGGKTTHGPLPKASNHWLKWILVEIGQTLTLAPGPVGTHYRHLLRAKGKPKATTAAARKLCCYIYWMLKEGWTYTEWLQQHQNSRRPEVRPMQRLGAMA